MDNNVQLNITVSTFPVGQGMYRYDVRVHADDGIGSKMRMELSTPRFKAAAFLRSYDLPTATVNGLLTLARSCSGRDVNLIL